jgi:hypothetical protein
MSGEIACETRSRLHTSLSWQLVSSISTGRRMSFLRPVRNQCHRKLCPCVWIVVMFAAFSFRLDIPRGTPTNAYLVIQLVAIGVELSRSWRWAASCLEGLRPEFDRDTQKGFYINGQCPVQIKKRGCRLHLSSSVH